jgi:hypothetical protein
MWKDKMLFVNSHGLIAGDDIDNFGRLANGSLGGSNVGSIEQVAQEYCSRSGPLIFIENPQCNATVFKVSAHIAGFLTFKGPTPEEPISLLDTEDEWREQIKENFPNETGAAYCESDTLLCALLDSNINTSEVLSFPNPKINWRDDGKIRALASKHSQEWVKHHLHRQLNTQKVSEVER